MKGRRTFTVNYWREEWAGLWAGKWRFAAFLIAWVEMLRSIQNNGYFSIRIPGQLYAIYYLGLDPAIWGFLAGICLVAAINKGEQAALARRKELELKANTELFQKIRDQALGETQGG